MGKQFGKILNVVAWLTGILVSLAVGFAMTACIKKVALPFVLAFVRHANHVRSEIWFIIHEASYKFRIDTYDCFFEACLLSFVSNSFAYDFRQVSVFEFHLY